MYPYIFTELQKLSGLYQIKLVPLRTLFVLIVLHHIPIPLLGKVEEELMRMEEMGGVSEIEEPTDRCAGVSILPKPNGEIWMCVDAIQLNKSVCRERYAFHS